MSRFVIRIDDVCPGMRWEPFSKLREWATQAGVRPLIGVVPDNRDPLLTPEAPRPDFWDTMRVLEEEGWHVAQHGYQHVYRTTASGDLGIGRRSEFAGLSALEQRTTLQRGRDLLMEQGLATDTFMAPSHSFDGLTCEALVSLGFRHVTDGWGLSPYRSQGLTFVPQLFATPRHIGFGVYTVCLHPNAMSADSLQSIGRFITQHHDQIIDFAEAAQVEDPLPKSVSRGLRAATQLGTRLLRSARDRRLVRAARPG